MEKPKATVPGLHYMERIMDVYNNSWRSHADAMNSFWEEMLGSKEIKLSSVLQHLQKIGQLCQANMREIFDSYASVYRGGANYGGPIPGVPQVPFVLDASATTSTPVTIPVPGDLEDRFIDHTPLEQIDPVVRERSRAAIPKGKDTRSELPQVSATLPSRGRLRLDVVNLNNQIHRAGHYTTVIYDTRLPPPRAPLAIVDVIFTNMPTATGSKVKMDGGSSAPKTTTTRRRAAAPKKKKKQLGNQSV